MNNNENPRRNVVLGNSGVPQSHIQVPQTMPSNHNRPTPHLHPQGGSHFPGHFQLTGPAGTQGAHPQLRAQAQAQAQAHSFAHLQNSRNRSNGGVGSPAVGGSGSAKRVSQRPPSRPSGSSGHGQASASPLKTMELAPAARVSKRKVPEREIPDSVAAILPESALYTQLREVEAQLDASLWRKKADVEESLKNPPRLQRTLRIYVFNTFSNQPEAVPVNDNAEPPSWSLKITGRILEEGKDPVASGIAQSNGSSYPKFSSFFKKITIYLDQNLYPDNNVILWESSRLPAPREGFEVKRTGDKEFTAVVRLEMNFAPEKFKLSPALQEVLGIEVESRPKVLAAVWHYVKTRKLQIPDDTSSFICDAALRKVFGEEKLKFSMVVQKITQHLTALQPIQLQHKIKLSGSLPAGNTCYDVLVDVPFPLQKETTTFLSDLEKNKEIDDYDETICAAIKKIHEHHQRRAFFLGFSQSPAEFVKALVASQSRDLKLAAEDTYQNTEKEQQSEFYNQPWLEDAVIRYLNRNPGSGSDVPAIK